MYAVTTILAVPLAVIGLLRLQAAEIPNGEVLAHAVLFTLPAVAFVLLPPYEAHAKGRRRVFRTSANRPWRKFSKRLVTIDAQRLLVPFGMAFLVASATTGISLLPHIPAHMGGAEPRTANLFVRPSDVDNATQELLFGDAVWESGDVARATVTVTVVFRNSDIFFIRIPPNDGRNDASIELPTSTVHGVLWH